MTITNCPKDAALREIASGRNAHGEKVDFPRDSASAALSAPCPLEAERDQLRALLREVVEAAGGVVPSGSKPAGPMGKMMSAIAAAKAAGVV